MQKLKKKSIWMLWRSKERNGKLFYSINSSHPYIKDVLENTDIETAAKIKLLLKLIAETIPAESIGFEISKSESKKFSSPYETEPEEYSRVKDELVQSFVRQGMSEDEAKEQVFYEDWHLAKRQMTWFKRNKNIKWLKLEEIYSYVLNDRYHHP